MDGDDIPAAGNRVQVVVRVRPLMPAEIREEVAVTCSDDGSTVQVQAPFAGARAYTFDSCMKGPTSQEELFNACGFSELVEAALDGYSVTVFAFGQTGSGKTHTMIGPRLSRSPGSGPAESSPAEEEDDYNEDGYEGGAKGPSTTKGYSEEEDGVLPRCIRAAFASIEERREEAQFSVSTSCVELYQETATDLLAKGKQAQSQNLPVRQNPKEGFRVEGLSWAACPTPASALSHMKRALSVRHTRSHKLNAYSSRSHCLITFRFESQEKALEAQGSKGGVKRYGKLTLVDLAGSERLKETGNTSKDAVRETGSINKSLFTLGQVLASLSARSQSSTPVFIPYRDSKLTSLLWEGLKGTGRALMLACLGPTLRFVEESMNTLHFASMALRIKATPVIILDPQDKLVLELRDTIRQLRDENRQLAVSLIQISSGEADISSIMDALPPRLLANGPAAGTSSAPGSSPGGMRARYISSGLSSPNSPTQESRLPAYHQRSSDPVSSPFIPQSPNRLNNNNSQGKSRGTQGGYQRAGSSGFGQPSSPMLWRRPTGSPSTVSSFLRQPSPSNTTQPRPKGSYKSMPSLPQLQVVQPSSSPADSSVGGDFPELAAMEAEFQMLMASGGGGLVGGGGGGGGGGGDYPSSPVASSPSLWTSQRNNAASKSHPFDRRLTSPLNPAAMAPPPDTKALKWADVNTWFGTDTTMTDHAYKVGLMSQVNLPKDSLIISLPDPYTPNASKVHDELVGGDGMDPESEGYYRELERRVSEAFPERWAAWLVQQEVRKAGGGLRAQGKKSSKQGNDVGRSQKASVTPSATQSAYQTMQEAFNRASKPSKLTSMGHFLPPVASTTSSPSTSPDHYPSQSRESSPVSIRQPLATPPSEPQYNSRPPQPIYIPGGIGRLDASPSPSPSYNPPSRGALSKPNTAQQVTPVFQLLDFGEIQKEYMKQRQVVVDELRNAKKEMEMERERIREKINRMLGKKGGNFRF